MTVDLLLVLLLHTEYDLRGHDALVGILEVQVRVEPEGRRILEQVCSDWLMVDSISHVPARLVHAKKGQTVEDARVYLPTTVRDDAYNHLVYKSKQVCHHLRSRRRITFFHASTPHVCEFLRLHRCAILRITPYKVLQNKISSS
jgi:hypothetical protein